MSCDWRNNEIPMDKYFMRHVQCMLRGKTSEYKEKFMQELRKANDYMNRSGGSIHSRQFVVTLMLTLDKEFENEGNEIKENDVHS